VAFEREWGETSAAKSSFNPCLRWIGRRLITSCRQQQTQRAANCPFTTQQSIAVGLLPEDTSTMRTRPGWRKEEERSPKPAQHEAPAGTKSPRRQIGSRVRQKPAVFSPSRESHIAIAADRGPRIQFARKRRRVIVSRLFNPLDAPGGGFRGRFQDQLGTRAVIRPLAKDLPPRCLGMEGQSEIGMVWPINCIFSTP